jgi:hypothetical protein
MVGKNHHISVSPDQGQPDPLTISEQRLIFEAENTTSVGLNRNGKDISNLKRVGYSHMMRCRPIADDRKTEAST